MGKSYNETLSHTFTFVHNTEVFTNRWTISLCSANSPIGTPVLYQHLTDIIFKELLREKYSVSANDLSQHQWSGHKRSGRTIYVYINSPARPFMLVHKWSGQIKNGPESRKLPRTTYPSPL